jgi:hypothetical protein
VVLAEASPIHNGHLEIEEDHGRGVAKLVPGLGTIDVH